MTNKSKNQAKDFALNGVLIALVFIATYFIQIRLPISINGGLVHLGNVVLFTIAILFGRQKGAIAGAFGMGIFDVVSGWMAWAPFTFVIRGLMGWIIGSVAHRNGREGRNVALNVLGIVAGSVVMIAGYYVTEGILYGNWVAPVTSIPGNLTQLGFGLLSLALAPALMKTRGLAQSFRQEEY